MRRIGVDPAGVSIMSPKQFHYNLLVKGLTPAQANIIKQEMLALGGEAAVNKGAVSSSIDSTDAVISGTARQFDSLGDKLAIQPFRLAEAASALKRAIENIGRDEYTLVSRSRSWTLGRSTLIMGILNVTPDSFSDGSDFSDVTGAIARARQMRDEGADWIDVGGESTRPGAAPVSEDEELRRVMPVVESIAASGVAVSIDTSKAGVARRALEAGALIVNDVTALSDPLMASVCAEYKAVVVLMHKRGTPSTMQSNVDYEDLIAETFEFLASRLDYARKAGIASDSLVIDPGLGFGKSGEGNLTLLKSLCEFKSLGALILIGASRKSFIGKIIGGEAEANASARLSGTLAANTAAILNGAHIVRVHDVRQAKEAALVADAIKNAG
ncbi:MAG: dihydropteroate synthase [Deltaproteobacteria bacterium]|nr:dihydropteroate synthase [Deltaproteobacteria bacterium]